DKTRRRHHRSGHDDRTDQKPSRGLKLRGCHRSLRGCSAFGLAHVERTPSVRYPKGEREGAERPGQTDGMCGIAGLIDWRAAISADALRSIGTGMAETLQHRGPDGGDVWVEPQSG